MQSSTRTNQGGSILIFTIVAVVLALALVGSVLFIRHKGEVAQTKVPIFGPVTAPVEVPNNEGGNAPSQGEDKPAPTTSPQNSPAPTQSAPAPSPANELPKTGLADVAGSMLIVALVTMVAVGYVRSRHLSWQL